MGMWHQADTSLRIANRAALFSHPLSHKIQNCIYELSCFSTMNDPSYLVRGG